MPANR